MTRIAPATFRHEGDAREEARVLTQWTWEVLRDVAPQKWYRPVGSERTVIGRCHQDRPAIAVEFRAERNAERNWTVLCVIHNAETDSRSSSRLPADDSDRPRPWAYTIAERALAQAVRVSHATR